MIVVRLRGGLGNQLFQYAAGKALSEHHHTDLKLDLYTYTRHKYRKYELSKFNIDANEADRRTVHSFTGGNPLVRLLNKRENYFRCPRVFVQPHYHFYDDFLSLPDNLYLSGYWQSEKHFDPVKDLISRQFTPKTTLDDRNQLLQREMRGCNSISVHVRRGDYASPGYASFFRVLPLDYYHAAIELMRAEIPSPVLYFFSDDPSWCREAFRGQGICIDHNTNDDAFKDLLLMSSCRHHIIANSTFSWWGAWLNKDAGKKVIAPKAWFGADYLSKKEPVYPSRFYNTKDLTPGTWKRI
jgi:hypothetical protein